MQTNAAEIETIVRVVLQRLRAVAAAPASPAKASSSPVAETPAPGTLQLTHKLVTLEQLDGKLDSLRIVQVAPRAVVTPAVIDELRRHGIQLQRVAPTKPGTLIEDSGLLIVGTDPKTAEIGKQFQRLVVVPAANDAQCQQQCLAIAQHLSSGGKRVIWCSAKPYAATLAAVCQAKSVRPIMLARLSDLARALEEADPNLLILDDREWSAAALGNLARAWKRSWK